MASSLPSFQTKTLDNGLQIVVIPMNNNSDVITTDIFYKVGSGNEIMGKSGIAHMLEHLNFKSTKNLKSGEFDEIVKGFGGVNNASTGFDYTHYYIKSSSKNSTGWYKTSFLGIRQTSGSIFPSSYSSIRPIWTTLTCLLFAAR